MQWFGLCSNSRTTAGSPQDATDENIPMTELKATDGSSEPGRPVAIPNYGVYVSHSM